MKELSNKAGCTVTAHAATTIQFEANDYPTMLVAFVTANDAQTTTYFVLSTLMFCQTITNGQHKQNFTHKPHTEHTQEVNNSPCCLIVYSGDFS